MTENELTLQDRLGVIRDLINANGEDNFVLSFSGGKDSTLLHHLIDQALPNNRIPRVFMDTGIEYKAIVDFVKELQSQDERFTIIKPTRPIKTILETYGYPFKSKQHSHILGIYQNSGLGKSVNKYLGTESGNVIIRCPKMLEYQFNDNGLDTKISDQCCYRLKKEPFAKWLKQSSKSITMTGMRSSEGGQRKNLDCIVKNNGVITMFHPLSKVDNHWVDWYIKEHHIRLCNLYYSPYNFTRTGCKGCPFNINLQRELDTLAMYLPNEYAQCQIIWKPIYDEYRRINYRLNNDITLFNYSKK